MSVGSTVRYDFPNDNHFQFRARYDPQLGENIIDQFNTTLTPRRNQNVKVHYIAITNSDLSNPAFDVNAALVTHDPAVNDIEGRWWKYGAYASEFRYCMSAFQIDVERSDNSQDYGTLVLYFEQAFNRDTRYSRTVGMSIGAGFYVSDEMIKATVRGHAGTYFALNSNVISRDPFQVITGLDIVQVGLNFEQLPTINGDTLTVFLRKPTNVDRVKSEKIRLIKLNNNGNETNNVQIFDAAKIYDEAQMIDLGQDRSGKWNLQRITTYTNGIVVKSAKLQVDKDTDTITESIVKESEIIETEFEANSPLIVFDEVASSLPQLSEGRCN